MEHVFKPRLPRQEHVRGPVALSNFQMVVCRVHGLACATVSLPSVPCTFVLQQPMCRKNKDHVGAWDLVCKWGGGGSTLQPSCPLPQLDGILEPHGGASFFCHCACQIDRFLTVVGQGSGQSSLVATSPLWDEEINDASRGVAAIEAGLLDPSYLSALVHISPDFPRKPMEFVMLPHVYDSLKARDGVRRQLAAAGLASPGKTPGEQEAALFALSEELAVSSELVCATSALACVCSMWLLAVRARKGGKRWAVGRRKQSRCCFASRVSVEFFQPCQPQRVAGRDARWPVCLWAPVSWLYPVNGHD